MAIKESALALITSIAQSDAIRVVTAAGASRRIAMSNFDRAVGALALTKAAFSSLPQTITDSRITADMVCVEAVLGTPSAQTGDWTVTTAAGSLTIAGSISGSTTLTLYLARTRA